MTKGEIWKIYFDAYSGCGEFGDGVVWNIDDADAKGSLAGALACYEAGCKVTDDLLEAENDSLRIDVERYIARRDEEYMQLLRDLKAGETTDRAQHAISYDAHSDWLIRCKKVEGVL